jgi:hypothetical protein
MLYNVICGDDTRTEDVGDSVARFGCRVMTRPQTSAMALTLLGSAARDATNHGVRMHGTNRLTAQGPGHNTYDTTIRTSCKVVKRTSTARIVLRMTISQDSFVFNSLPSAWPKA